MSEVMDKYDEAVAYLTKNPREIQYFWDNHRPDGPGCLFQFCGDPLHNPGLGCPVMIRTGRYSAGTPELTAGIDADTRIPKTPAGIKAENLPAFAEWQRKVDEAGIRDAS